jgi:predicted glycosyltransferase
VTRRTKVWIDLTNSPHVLFFRPILRRLDEAGTESVVTARDYAQTLGLLELYGIRHIVVGRHGGARIAGKMTGFARRSLALTRFARSTRGIRQAVSHGSNDLSVAARLLRLHSTVLHDYEGATTMHRINFRLADKVMVPEVIPFDALRPLGLDERRYRPYAGIKEQVSLADFDPDLTVLQTLGLDAARPVAVLRPPATMSLYHRGLENRLFDDVLEHIQATDAQVVLLPRTLAQAAEFSNARAVTVPARPVDGPSLVYAADLVVSAGGTMNREAALLGTPTWTTFAGEMGAVDRMLIDSGRMQLLERPEQLVVEKRRPAPPQYEALADAVTEEILRM